MIDKTPTKEENADRIIFKGILQECQHNSLINSHTHRILRPIVAMNAPIFRMFAFLQIERAPGGRWQLHAWSLLSEKAVAGMMACVAVKTKDGKVFTAQLPILPLLSKNKLDALLKGHVFDLFDVHVVPENPTCGRIFEYEFRILSTAAHRTHLNKRESDSETFTAFMDEVVGKLGVEAQLRTLGGAGPPLSAPTLAEPDEVVIEADNINPATSLDGPRLPNPIIAEMLARANDDNDDEEEEDEEAEEEEAEEENEEEENEEEENENVEDGTDEVAEIRAFIENQGSDEVAEIRALIDDN